MDFRDRTKPRTQDTLQASDPSLRENLVALLGKGLGDDKASHSYARQAGGLLDFIPFLGGGLAADDTKRSLEGGDYLGAGIAALGAIPGAGKFAKKGAMAGREALTELVKGSKGVVTEAAEKAVKTGRQKAITANSLRQKPLDEAIEIARSEEHLIPKPGGGGGFVGAPHSAQTKADLELIRQKFDADVEAGAAGADWYPRAQEWIKKVAGPDPARQSELARNLALFSAQADPGGNLGFSIKARNNAIMGMTPVGSEGQEGVVRTGQQWRTYKDAYDRGEGGSDLIGHNGGPRLEDADIKLGKKTGVYADHMDPTRTSPTTGTNDIWHARALGYTTPEGEPWSAALSPQQHSFMDAETVLAVDRANQAGIGGRFDWTPGEIQAAPWVAGKGRGLMEKRGMTEAEGLAEASKTYPDYAPAYTASGTHEMVPGRSTGHLPGIANADQATRDAFSQGEGNWWQNAEGKDVLYDAQGAYHDPTIEAHGVYGDPVQFNPMQAARPMVGFSGNTGERVLDPASRQLLTGTESTRAYFDAQDAGASSISIPGQKTGHNNAFDLRLPSNEPSREDLASIMKTGRGEGMPDIVHYGGDKAALTEFYPGKQGVGAKQTKAMNKALGDQATASPTRLESTYSDFQDAWKKGEGSDAATKQMLEGLNAKQLQALDAPEVRAKVLERFDRDARVAEERGDVLRKDIQLARKLFAEGGFKALKENLGKGLLPVAAAGLFFTQRDGGGGDEEG